MSQAASSDTPARWTTHSMPAMPLPAPQYCEYPSCNFFAGCGRAERGDVEEANKRITAAQAPAQRVADFAGGAGNKDTFHGQL